MTVTGGAGYIGALLVAELTTGGGKQHLAPFDAFWGQRYATVLDNDGNGIDLFAPQPSTESGG